MPKTALALIRLYQLTVRPFLPPRCRFYPSCSDYAAQAVTSLGAGRGGLLALRRLLRCHPFSSGGYDPVHGCSSPILRNRTIPFGHG